MIEVGKTTTTQYGLRKGKSIYQTKVCVEVIPERPGVNRPRLILKLPYPKRKLMDSRRYYEQQPVKGLAWAEVWYAKDEINFHTEQIFFFLGKSRTRYSKVYRLTEYGKLYQALTGNERSFNSIEDLVDLALEEWRTVVEV